MFNEGVETNTQGKKKKERVLTLTHATKLEMLKFEKDQTNFIVP